MSGLAEQIAAAREKCGITAADAARRLHMRTEFIHAIEAGEFAKLGPPVYARGFVRNYARLVGIDPAAIGEQLDDAIPSRDSDAHIETLPATAGGELQPEPVPINVRIAHAPEPRAAWYPWLLGAMSTLAAVLVLAVLYYTFGPAPRDQSAAVSNQSANAPQAAAPTPAPQDDAIFNGAGVATTPAEQARSGVDLQLQLTQDSWLSVTVDGKRVVYETLPAGTVRDFHGVREITLRAGNAGGVIATIDGKPLGTLGQHGQVEERSFAAKNAAPSIGPRE